ncbi:hypothetical protein MY1884_004077 [Beauveria asiatica]
MRRYGRRQAAAKTSEAKSAAETAQELTIGILEAANKAAGQNRGAPASAHVREDNDPEADGGGRQNWQGSATTTLERQWEADGVEDAVLDGTHAYHSIPFKASTPTASIADQTANPPAGASATLCLPLRPATGGASGHDKRSGEEASSPAPKAACSTRRVQQPRARQVRKIASSLAEHNGSQQPIDKNWLGAFIPESRS